MSTQWMKLLIGVGVTASLLSLNGCGSDDDTVTANPAMVTFGVTPVKGPFSKISTINAYGLKTGGGLTPVSASIAGQSGNTFRVSVPLASVKDNDNIVLNMSGEFSGDVKADGSTDTTTKPISGFMVPINTSGLNADTTRSVSQELSTTVESGMVDHMASSLALKDLGVLETSGSAPSVKTTNLINQSFSTKLGANRKKVSQQLGLANYATNTRKAAESLLSSRILKAFGSNAATNFTTFFSGFTKDLATAANFTAALTSTSYLQDLTTGEFQNVSTALGAQGVTTSQALQDSATNSTITTFYEADINVRLTNHPTAETRMQSSYATTVSVTYGSGSTAHTDSRQFIRDIEDGLFHKVDAAPQNDNNHTVYSRLKDKFTTDTINISTVGTNPSISTTNIHSVSIIMGGRSFTVENSGQPLESTTSASYDFDADHLVSSAKFLLTTPTNYDGAKPNVDSSYGIWFTTSSSFESTATTSLSTSSFYLRPFINNGSSTTYLSDYRRDTRGNFRRPSANGLEGVDLVQAEQALQAPTSDDLTNGAITAWLTVRDLPGIHRHNPAYNAAFAVAQVDLSEGKTTESVALTSVPTSDRLSAAFSMSGTTMTVVAPKLQTLDATNGSIMVQNSSGELVSADAGIRYGLYAAVIRNSSYTAAQFFSVDKDGKVWSHGGPAATTSALTRYTEKQLGTVDNFNFSLDSSNVSTNPGFVGMKDGQACHRFVATFGTTFKLDGKCEPHTVGTTAAASAASILSTATDTVVAIHNMLPLNFEHETNVGALVSAHSGTALTATTHAMLEGAVEDRSNSGNISFILGTPTDSDVNNEKQGFWVIPESAGTASTAITTRVTNPSAGFSGEPFFHTVVCNANNCFWNYELRTQGPNRRYGYSQMGVDLINGYTMRPALMATDLNDGNKSVEVYWDPFFDTSHPTRDTAKGLKIGEGAIASGATSGTVQLLNSLPMPTATVTY